MKTVGIIGGLGPETTAKFCLRVVSLCLNQNVLQRPEIISINVPISLELEKRFINKSKGRREFRSLLINAAKKLEESGVDFIVMPCNTAHIFIDDIRKSVNAPVLSIIDETVSCFKKNHIKTAGLLATPATVKNKLFENKINIVKPNNLNQKEMGVIVNKILNNVQTNKDKLTLFKIINAFSQKPDGILLACTDLQLLITERKHNGIKIFDTMEILAQATAKEILSQKSLEKLN